MKQGLAIALALAMGSAQAQGTDSTDLSQVEVPPAVRAGQAAKITIRAGSNPPRWCGLQVDFGDGQTHSVRVGPDIFFPVTLDVTYPRPGDYTIRASGTRITTRMPCAGVVTANVRVAAAPVAAPAATAAPAQCPETVTLANASGETVSFGLAQMVRDAGGLASAREQVSRRIIEAQDRALDDKLAAAERDNAKRFSTTLKSLREHLANCR